MEKDIKKPQIRFQGFTEEWEQRKLGEIAVYGNGSGHEEHVLSQGKYELITLKSINSEGKLISSGKYLDIETETLKKGVIIMMLSEQAQGMLGMTTVIPCDNKYVLNQRIASLTPIEDYESSFLTKAINNKQTYFEQMGAGTKVQNITKGNVENCTLNIPKIDEQKKIGDFFDSLDNLITLHQRKYDSLVKVKKSMLEKMFPRRGAKKPEIRFAGFTDDWEQRKFGELYEKVSRKNDLTYGVNDIISVANMYYKTDTNITNKDYLKTYNVFELGDIAFEGNKSKKFAHGRFVENTIGNGIVSHVFDVFKPIAEYDLLFWKYAINNERIMGSILTRVTKSSTMMTNLVANDFLKETICVPCIDEQKQIGAFFDKIDNLISLHQRKLNLLKNIKKAMLEKMFV